MREFLTVALANGSGALLALVVWNQRLRIARAMASICFVAAGVLFLAGYYLLKSGGALLLPS